MSKNLFELYALIREFASDDENQRPEDDSVIWDFVAADVHMDEKFKASQFNAKDVDLAMDDISSRWGL